METPVPEATQYHRVTLTEHEKKVQKRLECAHTYLTENGPQHPNDLLKVNLKVDEVTVYGDGSAGRQRLYRDIHRSVTAGRTLIFPDGRWGMADYSPLDEQIY